MSLAGGFRWIGWGKDFDQYLIAYNTISPAFLFGSTRFEIGYELISWIFAVQLGASYGLLYFVLCFISLGFKFYLFNKYLRYPILACIVYLLLFYPIHEYTQIRAAVAIAFGFAGIHFLLDRRWIPAICLFALAPLFHSSIAVLIGLGTLAVFIPQRIALVVVPVGALLILVVSSAASNALASVFVTFNPLVYSYLDNVAAGDAINIFSGSNILYALTILAMIVTKVYKLEAYIFKFMFMLVFGYLFLFAFKGAPVIALRMSEVVMLSSIFCVFRIPLQVRTFYIHSLMLVNGIWFTYRAFVEGTLG